MSKIKSPPEEKQLSLSRDRRNSYRENDKASRKNIPRAKARSHREERRCTSQELFGAVSCSTEAAIELVEANVRSTSRINKVSAFRKSPDEPLGSHIKKQVARQKMRGSNA